MYTLLLVSSRMGDLSDFTATISAPPDITLHQVDSRKDALRMVREQNPHLVIIDQEIRDNNPLELVMELLAVNAMINTAMITSMDADEWHEKSEGLGMMPPISDSPTEKEALALLEAFRKMPGLA
ncbi:MAG TPA: response regulator [Desulfobulbus sp.]|nr:response regulator [Desulfobulbus sp.]